MMKKGLNLGSGQRPFMSTEEIEWINVDAQAKWSPDLVARAEDLSMVSTGSIDYAVAHHVLEHYGCGEGSAMVREAFRVLKPWGSLIVSVPDMRSLAKGWLDGRIDDQVYLTNIYGAFMEDEADRHKWGFTPKTLKKEIERTAEWRCVIPFDSREIPGAQIARDWWILTLEAMR